MKSYLDCWISTATALFSQALAGEPQLSEAESPLPSVAGQNFVAEISGDVKGSFTVGLDPEIIKAPLLGEGVDQAAAWVEFLREVAESAAGELLASSGTVCHIEDFHSVQAVGSPWTRSFRLSSQGGSWTVCVLDEVEFRNVPNERGPSPAPCAGDQRPENPSSGVGLLLDIELEAALRFGCREMPLGEILDLGPGDVVELDRHITDPVDLVVGDKIVARGEVVLVNGNFGLRVIEVAEPQKRLESIRCLF